MNTTTKDIFEETLSYFKKRLTPKELKDFTFATLDEVRILIVRIQKDQEAVKKTMNMSRIQSFLQAMTEFGKVVECFLNVSDIIAFIWGPMKFLLQVLFARPKNKYLMAVTRERLLSRCFLSELMTLFPISRQRVHGQNLLTFCCMRTGRSGKKSHCCYSTKRHLKKTRI